MKTHYETVNLQLHVIHSFISTREGACRVCGLPGYLAGLMSIPGLPGHFCCIACVECYLFGPGRCRWCSFALNPNEGAFCCQKCRRSNDTSPFGSGRRFGLWLNRQNPRLYAKLAGKEIPTAISCLQCADSLDGKRRDSLFCRYCANFALLLCHPHKRIIQRTPFREVRRYERKREAVGDFLDSRP